MPNYTDRLPGSQPAGWQIKIKGKIRADLSDWLNGMEIFPEKVDDETQVTTLIGIVADQAALRGILCKIWDLNLTILSFSQVEINPGEKEGEK